MDAVAQLTASTEVIETVLARNPDLCPIAIKLHYDLSSKQLGKSVLSFILFYFLTKGIKGKLTGIAAGTAALAPTILQQQAAVEDTLFRTLTYRGEHVSIQELKQAVDSTRTLYLYTLLSYGALPLLGAGRSVLMQK